MDSDSAKTSFDFSARAIAPAPLARSYFNLVGRLLLRVIDTVHGLGAFALITLGVVIQKWNRAPGVIHPLIRQQVQMACVRLLPMVAFIGLAIGLGVIGQTMALIAKVGAVQNLAGTIMVTAVVRELGPLIAALLVLVRVGTKTVIELGMSRARGEVEVLESLGIDPIHYLVVPRVIGQAIAIFALTIYLVMISLGSGYLFAFLQNASLAPSDYLHQLVVALEWHDFLLIAVKTLLFGAMIATITCYQGLAHPLRMEQVAEATTRAVVYSIVSCVVIDVSFIVLYFLL